MSNMFHFLLPIKQHHFCEIISSSSLYLCSWLPIGSCAQYPILICWGRESSKAIKTYKVCYVRYCRPGLMMNAISPFSYLQTCGQSKESRLGPHGLVQHFSYALKARSSLRYYTQRQYQVSKYFPRIKSMK